MPAAMPVANALPGPRRSSISNPPNWESLVEPLHDALDTLVAPLPDSRILDLSCGDGARLEALAARVEGTPRLVGVDTNRRNIDRARMRPGLHLVRADPAAFLVHTSAVWDVVTARFCLPVVGWEKLPKRALTALASGGRLGILTCLADSAPEAWAMLSEMSSEAGIRLPAPWVPPSSGALETALQEAGFAHVELHAHARTVAFHDSTEAVSWLVAAGFASHPWLSLLDVETLSHLGENLAERLSRFDGGEGIRLTFNIVCAVAEAP